MPTQSVIGEDQQGSQHEDQCKQQDNRPPVGFNELSGHLNPKPIGVVCFYPAPMEWTTANLQPASRRRRKSVSLAAALSRD